MIKKLIMSIIICVFTASFTSASLLPNKFMPQDNFNVKKQQEIIRLRKATNLSKTILAFDNKAESILMEIATYSEPVKRNTEEYNALLIVIYSINNMRTNIISCYTHAVQLGFASDENVVLMYNTNVVLFRKFYFKLLATAIVDLEYNANFIKDKKLASKTISLIKNVAKSYSGCVDYMLLLVKQRSSE